MSARSIRIGAGLLLLAVVSLAGPGAARADIGDTCFNEKFYLERNPDVAAAVAAGKIASARVHYETFGKDEGRLACTSADYIPSVPLTVRAILLVVALSLLFWRSRARGWGSTNTAVCAAIAVAVFAYFDFVTGRKAFVFLDIASDTAYQFWPMMTHLSNLIWSGQFPMWSFEVGVGQNIFPTWLADPFALVAILSGKTLLPWALGVMQVAKICVAVGFMAAYFKLAGYTRNACIIGALSVGFCGHMVSRGTWYEYATEVVVIAFYLFAFERFARTGRYALLALATAMIGLCQTYWAYLYGVLFLIFACVRMGAFPDTLFQRRWPALWRYAAASIAGILMSGVFLLPDALATLSSPRMSGESEVFTATFSTPVTTTEDAKTVVTAIARAISPNLLGNARHFTGVGNYLEAPLAYAGLLGLLCIIPCFAFCNRRQRIILGVFLGAMLGYHYLSFFRLAINAFAGFYFKISNLWVPVGIALCTAKTIDGVERGDRVPWRHFAASLVLTVALLATVDIESEKLGMSVWRSVLWLAVALVLGYGVVLLGHDPAWRVRTRVAALLGLLLLELSATSFQSVGVGRRALDAVFSGRDAGYYDLARTVIQRVRREDPALYRIERDRFSVCWMDALMQDNLATAEYLSFTASGYVDFLRALGLLSKDRPRTESYLDGVGPHALVLPLFGVKYYLSHDGGAPLGYAKQSSFDGVAIFQNAHAGSLGHFYSRAISREDFLAIKSPHERAAVLLRAAVVEPAVGAATARVSKNDALALIAPDFPECRDSEDCISEDALKAALESWDDHAVNITRMRGNRIEGTVEAKEAGVLFLSVAHDKGWRLLVDGASAPVLRVNLGFLGAELPAGKHTFRLDYTSPGVATGGLLSLLGLVGLGGAVVARRLKVRR
jgi:uncharacterized membrane protein YfhO